MSKNQKSVIAFGEVLWDFLPSGKMLGGAPLNFCYRIGSLGLDARIASRVGSDSLGIEAASQVSSLGMDLSLLQTDKTHATGRVNVAFDAAKSPQIDVEPNSAYEHIALTDILIQAASSVDCICFGTLAQRGEATRRTLHHLLDKAPNALKVYDINLRPSCFTAEIIAASLQRCDILKLNKDEVEQIRGLFDLGGETLPAFCDELLARWQIAVCVVTLEDRGVFIASAKGEKVYVPGFKIDLVDPLGAGDAFTAGFVYNYLNGATLAQSGRLGNRMGAMVASQCGATKPLPSDKATFDAPDSPRCIDPDFAAYMAL